jgi:hypothetical protein
MNPKKIPQHIFGPKLKKLNLEGEIRRDEKNRDIH